MRGLADGSAPARSTGPTAVSITAPAASASAAHPGPRPLPGTASRRASPISSRPASPSAAGRTPHQRPAESLGVPPQGQQQQHQQQTAIAQTATSSVRSAGAGSGRTGRRSAHTSRRRRLGDRRGSSSAPFAASSSRSIRTPRWARSFAAASLTPRTAPTSRNEKPQTWCRSNASRRSGGRSLSAR